MLLNVCWLLNKLIITIITVQHWRKVNHIAWLSCSYSEGVETSFIDIIVPTTDQLIKKLDFQYIDCRFDPHCRPGVFLVRASRSKLLA